jgi:hypothetical protein
VRLLLYDARPATPEVKFAMRPGCWLLCFAATFLSFHPNAVAKQHNTALRIGDFPASRRLGSTGAASPCPPRLHLEPRRGTRCSRPGDADIDISLQKEFALPAGARLQPGWDTFNLPNHVNFDVLNQTAFTPNFGRIVSALPARQMQLGVQVLF